MKQDDEQARSGLTQLHQIDEKLGIQKTGDKTAYYQPSPETASNDPPVESTNRTIGDYEVLEILGEGGMGIVYQARSRITGQIVALKMIRPGALGTGKGQQRFLLEAEVAQSFEHPNIVPVYHVGLEQEQPYFCMKLVEGSDLKRHLKGVTVEQRRTRDYQRWIAALLAKLARAAHYAHDRGVIHRDLKPGNVLLDAEQEPFLCDFGLAKQAEQTNDHTETGAIAITPEYASPEQARGEVGLTRRTDVYSLGVILYEALTGVVPFRGENVLETIALLQIDDPLPPRERNPEIDHRLEAICLKCLQKDPEERYATAEALGKDLQRYLENQPSPTWPSTIRDFVANLFQSPFRLNEFAEIYWLILLMVLLSTPWYVIQYVLIRDYPEQEALLWATCFVPLIIGLLCGRYYRLKRQRAPTPAELVQRTLIRASSIAKLVILLAGRLYVSRGETFADVVKTTYPAVFAVLGVMYFAQGAFYWGRYNLHAVAYFLVALLIPLQLELAPLAFAALFCLGHLDLGLNLWRLYRRDLTKSPRSRLQPTTLGDSHD